VSEGPQEEGQNIPVQLPIELENGVYANWAVVHHTAHEITIDFCQQGIDPPLEAGQLSRAKVVARVHIPPTFAMSLLQILSQSSAQREDLLRDAGEGGQEHGS
jgi:hypothetical protein